jgi:hypothetical protein
MSEGVNITVNENVLQDLLIRARHIVKPDGTYSADNEMFLKNIIHGQIDNAVTIANILNKLIAGEK